jgi:hypothetical protein
MAGIPVSTDESIELEQPIQRRTRFTFIKLPKTERFVCARRDIKEVFGTDILGWVSAGTQKSKMYDRRYSPRPKFDGRVVAELSIGHHSDSTPILCLYATRRDQYSDEAGHEFRTEILPKMKAWFIGELAKPETRKLGNAECFVVEWTGSEHRIHHLLWF